MSAGDVVCTGWLIKSPPEKKLKRFTWRKRWFVLRRGRMSGNPDVLEYYQSKTSRKPLRTIDLRECEVHPQTGGLTLKRSLHQKFPFIVKTSTRVFYLVAKTEQEMNVWTDRIGQICQCGALKDAAESSDEGFPHTPTLPSDPLAPQGPHGPQDPLSHLPDPLSHLPHPGQPLDYLLLSQCETGRASVCISRCESFTSDSSLELPRSSDPEDHLSNSFSTPPSNFPPLGHAFRPPLSAPCSATLDPASRLLSSGSSGSSGSSALLQRDSSPSVFPFDGPFPLPSSSSFSLCTNQHPVPRLPPKPGHQPHASGPWQANELSHSRPIPRRISFSGMDHALTGHAEFSLRNKRLSLNLPSQLSSPAPALQADAEAYLPMSACLTRCSLDASDGYLPMRPLGGPGSGLEAPPRGHSPLRGPQDDLLPPPINRHLKPRQRARPPPLDLRGLSTIREFPTRPLAGPPMTSSGDMVDGFPSGPTYENEDDLDADDCYTPMFQYTSDGASGSWPRRSNLDYLSLDFNSASPSPVQKKALLVDEHKVDYVQVDEKKTQALQSTRLEWTDVRQSKP
ncbi:GRB2-associated-binding protein 3 isoform X1 [Gadus morhua]|uniref:GRB2-associated-binding protein 3 isoform X1 n=1 Tax=Gadus morhua TaxID=8049 RepID=UPI0011B5E036|nr:GRB2-associated-binding protein 3 isoform X1 [Gadus morhua]